jgi:hypothetical protein
MDTDTLVDKKIDGRKLLARLAKNGFAVAAACWVKTSEEERWFLYIASNAVDQKGLSAAYTDAYGALLSMDDPWISMGEIKLISPNHPIARDLVAILEKHSGRGPIRTNRPRIGDVGIEEGYIYPQEIGPMTRDEVLQAVAHLMDRSGCVPPASVTLRDGSTIRATPLGVDVPTPGKVEIRFLDVAGNTARTVDANDVVNVD